MSNSHSSSNPGLVQETTEQASSLTASARVTSSSPVRLGDCRRKAGSSSQSGRRACKEQEHEQTSSSDSTIQASSRRTSTSSCTWNSAGSADSSGSGSASCRCSGTRHRFQHRHLSTPCSSAASRLAGPAACRWFDTGSCGISSDTRTHACGALASTVDHGHGRKSQGPHGAWVGFRIRKPPTRDRCPGPHRHRQDDSEHDHFEVRHVPDARC